MLSTLFITWLALASISNSGDVSVSEALTGLYGVMNMRNFMHEKEIQLLTAGLIKKSGTLTPAQKSNIMLVDPFRKLFSSLGVNTDMSIDRLHLKVVASLPLTLVL